MSTSKPSTSGLLALGNYEYQASKQAKGSESSNQAHNYSSRLAMLDIVVGQKVPLNGNDEYSAIGEEHRFLGRRATTCSQNDCTLKLGRVLGNGRANCGPQPSTRDMGDP